MADLARLGFVVDSSPLDAAKTKMAALVPAAAAAEKATSGLGAAAAGMGKATMGAAAGVQSFAMGTTAVGKAALGASTAMGTVQRAAASVSGQIKVAGLATGVYAETLNKIPAAANNAKSSLDRLGAAAGANINKLQASPGNIAAQFQDIGVTAAGGMQPMLIALQQGTQLSAAFAGGGLKNLGAAFAQLLSPIALATIATVGVVAALVQMVNWTSVGKGALNGLAAGLEAMAPYAAGLAAVLLVAFGPQIISAIASVVVWIGTTLVSAIVSATTAMIAFAIANPFTAFVLAAAAGVAAMILFGNAIQDGMGDKTKHTAKDSANYIAGAFVTAFNTIKTQWRLFPAAIGDGINIAVNNTLRAVEAMVNGSIDRINGLTSKLPFGSKIGIGHVNLGQVANPYAGSYDKLGAADAASRKSAMGRDYVGDGAKAVGDGLKWAANRLRSVANGIGADDKKNKKGKTDGAASGKTDGEKFSDIVTGAQNDIDKEIARGKAIELTAVAAATLAQQQKLLNEASTKGITLTDAMRTKIDALASAYGIAKVAADRLVFARELDAGNAATLDGLKSEAATIGLYGRELAYATEYAKQFAAAKAKFKNDPEGLAAYAKGIPKSAGAVVDQGQSNATAKRMEDLRRSSEISTFANGRELESIGLSTQALTAYNFATEKLVAAKQAGITQSPAEIAAINASGAAYAQQLAQIEATREALDFTRESVKGFVSDLRSGLDAGKSLFQSFADATLNVLNKVIDKMLDLALNSALGGKGSSTGGFVSAIAGLFGAKSAGPVTKMAAGGVVTGRTTFDHAGGRSMMAEAGAEAIMPLKRGSDGSLGVAVSGGRRGANDNPAPVFHFEGNTYVINGSSTADMQATVRASAQQSLDQMRREVPQVLSDYQRNGTGPV